MTQQTFDSNIILESIELIKKYEPPEGYWLAFSGGKDSIVIYDLAKKSGVKFEAHMALTTVDPPEVVKFVRENYPDVILDKPIKSMFKLIEDHGWPPLKYIRYCCRALKEIGGTGHIVITGVRRQESVHRRNRPIFHKATRQKKKYLLNPIVTWKTVDVWDYIWENKLKYCSLYDEGYKRIGCIMCPLAGQKQILRDVVRYPKFYNAYVRAMDRAIQNRPDIAEKEGWKTGADMMHWWIFEKHKARVKRIKWLSKEIENWGT